MTVGRQVAGLLAEPWRSLCEVTHTACVIRDFVPLTINLHPGTFVSSNNSGNAGGIDMVNGKMFAAPAGENAPI